MLRNDRISIPVILDVEKNNFLYMGKIISKNKFKNIVIFFGTGIYALFGEKVISSFKETNINILKIYNYDDVNLEKIIDVAFTIPNETDAIIGIGGGRVNDVTKYICFLKHIPFISVPTSSSNDGFSSSSCSLLVNSKKTTLIAKVPYGIIVDIDVLKSAPVKFIYSGIGDLISKITALYDWKFEEQHGVSIVDDVAMMIAKKSVNSFARTEFETFKDDFFLKELIDSLVMNGLSVEIAQSSAPVSGSEHLISHSLDKILDNSYLHGIQVGVATYLMAKVQNHRFERIEKVLKKTGFFEYVKTLGMKKIDFEKAIDMAPSIKPERYTYLHEEKYRQMAKKLLYEEEILKEILL